MQRWRGGDGGTIDVQAHGQPMLTIRDFVRHENVAASQPGHQCSRETRRDHPCRTVQRHDVLSRRRGRLPADSGFRDADAPIGQCPGMLDEIRAAHRDGILQQVCQSTGLDAERKQNRDFAARGSDDTLFPTLWGYAIVHPVRRIGDHLEQFLPGCLLQHLLDQVTPHHGL